MTYARTIFTPTMCSRRRSSGATVAMQTSWGRGQIRPWLRHTKASYERVREKEIARTTINRGIYCPVLYCTVLCYTILYYTILHWYIKRNDAAQVFRDCRSSKHECTPREHTEWFHAWRVPRGRHSSVIILYVSIVYWIVMYYVIYNIIIYYVILY